MSSIVGRMTCAFTVHFIEYNDLEPNWRTIAVLSPLYNHDQDQCTQRYVLEKMTGLTTASYLYMKVWCLCSAFMSQ